MRAVVTVQTANITATLGASASQSDKDSADAEITVRGYAFVSASSFCV